MLIHNFCIKTMSSLLSKKLEYIQQIFLFLIGKVFSDRCTTKSQIQLINMPIQYALKERPLFQKKISGSLKNLFHFYFFFFLILETISHKNSDTCTSCPLIQRWLQACLVIPDYHCLAQLFQTWHNIEPAGRGDSGYL